MFGKNTGDKKMSKQLEDLKMLRGLARMYTDNEAKKIIDIACEGIEKELEEKEEQDNIIKIIKEVICFNRTMSTPKKDEQGNVSFIQEVSLKLQRQLENKERELFRNWVLKECFPKELKALEIIKNNKDMRIAVLSSCTKWDEYELLKEELL